MIERDPQPQGEVIAETDLDFGDHGTAVLRVVERDALPQELFGFSVKTYIGPYPADAPRSHRRAVYAELVPVHPDNVERMRRAGRTRILVSIPLTVEAARDIDADPQGKLAEDVGRDAIAHALPLARTVAYA